MTTERQSGTLHFQFGVTRVSIEELTKKVEHLLERTLTREECRFLVLASGLLESNGKPLSKAKAGAA
jgi:cation diffusion facilitator CzcD-associated flavoprotein CzcO